jgi:hypothetical protein
MHEEYTVLRQEQEAKYKLHTELQQELDKAMTHLQNDIVE